MPKRKKAYPSSNRRSVFDLRRHGVDEDPSKDFRWVKKDRIEERREMDGFTLTKGQTSDGHVSVKGMTLMERSQDRAEESRHEKEARTREQSLSTRESVGREVEKLSSKWGMNLHKAVNVDKLEQE
jgi:hypothetical protein